MKKLITLTLTAILLFAVVACNGGESNIPQIPEERELIGGFLEEEVIIGEGTQWELNGLLTIPQDITLKDDGTPIKFPAVVLVHGSGPQDMNSTVHSNKPFRDIAEYLSSHGIAVLRYDKRTLVHVEAIVENFSEFTVHEETVEDAILAANLLRDDERIDSDRIFVIGHSMGGILAPRIDAEGGDFAGLIIMAGSPRTMIPEILYDQFTAMSDEAEDIERVQLLALIEELYDLEHLPDITNDEAKQITFFGLTGYYIKNMNEYPSNEILQNLDKPVLIMHGDKDIQVFTDRDFGEYKELLEGRNNVTFKLYPNLNHLFMISTLGTVEEYEIPDTVDSQVLRDIVEWIRSI